MSRILLHSCCAPCSSAILEWMLGNGYTPVVFFYNPNIYPIDEYEKRKAEIVAHCQRLGIEYVNGDYDHNAWLSQCSPLADAPERGERCTLCFRLRLLAAAQKAAELGISTFATTLASSRWKNIEQVNAAGLWAAQQVNLEWTRNTLPSAQEIPDNNTPKVEFWANNWRKGGLQQRRQELLKQYGFYNQLYCGCEFSQRQKN